MNRLIINLKTGMAITLFAVLLFSLSSYGRATVVDSHALKPLTYKVQPGDSLWLIARKFDTHIDHIKVLNNLAGGTIHPNDTLFVPRVMYVVKRGDSLYTIAKTYGTSISDLRKANSLKSDLLRIGQQLLLPSHIKPRVARVSPDGTLTRTISREEFDLLARLVYAESGSEPYMGRVAVAASVLNRVDSPDYPNTITEVINHVVGENGYQYTPVANGRINNVPDELSKKAVEVALAGWDPTGGATGFYNPRATNDRWVRSRKVVTVIANHVFFI